MNSLVTLLLAGLVLGPPAGSRARSGDWTAIWERLERLERRPAAGESLAEPAELLAAARRLAPAPADPRFRLLEVRLERWSDPVHSPNLTLELSSEDPWPFTPRESWLAAEILVPGALRVRAVLAALAGTEEGELSRPELLVAWNTAVEEARALNLERGALPIQELLYQRQPAVWSAMDLALTCSRLGRAEEADRCLAETLQREHAAGRPTAELWSRRGLVALGNGDESRARDYLGRALIRGSSDAAVILAKLELDAGRTSEALAGFRSLLATEEPSAWTLRGWGLALLTLDQAPEGTKRTADADGTTRTQKEPCCTRSPSSR